MAMRHAIKTFKINIIKRMGWYWDVKGGQGDDDKDAGAEEKKNQ